MSITGQILVKSDIVLVYIISIYTCIGICIKIMSGQNRLFLSRSVPDKGALFVNIL